MFVCVFVDSLLECACLLIVYWSVCACVRVKIPSISSSGEDILSLLLSLCFTYKLLPQHCECGFVCVCGCVSVCVLSCSFYLIPLGAN